MEREAGMQNRLKDSFVAASLKKEKAVSFKVSLRDIVSHLRRIFIECLSLVFNHSFVYKIVGVLNKHLGLIESVFLVYPASERYALHYTYKSRMARIWTTPFPCGLIIQNNKLIIMFAVSMTEKHLRTATDKDKLRVELVEVVEKMENIRLALAAKTKTFSGILPGMFRTFDIHTEASEAHLTASVVVRAIEHIKGIECLDVNTPIIFLGSGGWVGRHLAPMLKDNEVYKIDLKDGQGENSWPDHLYGRSVIVLNVTMEGAIDNYVKKFWPRTIVINEVYPEPSQEILRKIHEKESCCYHVVGVKAISFPSFPKPYNGFATPCCSAFDSEDIEAVVRKI